MPLKLIAIVVVALAAGTGAGLAAGGGDQRATVKEAPLPGKAGKGKAVRVAGLEPAARIPSLVKVPTARQTTGSARRTFTQQTQVQTQTQIRTQTPTQTQTQTQTGPPTE